MTDADLEAVVERAKAGGSDALETLVRALQDQVYRLALRTTGNVEDARDACQGDVSEAVESWRRFG